MHPTIENAFKFYQKLVPLMTGHQLIRVGGVLDGGYLIPNILDGIQACLSPGTCGETTLENQLANQYGIRCLLCDPNDEESAIKLHRLNKFDKKYFSAKDTADSFSLSTWLSLYDLQDANPLMMSMDIEGEEVNVINNMSDSELNRFRIISVEYHYLHLLHSSDHNHMAYINQLNNALSRLDQFFDCVHFKPNTTCPYTIKQNDLEHTLYTCIEVTYLHKQLRLHKPINTQYQNLPHTLDQTNSADTNQADYTFYRQVFKRN